MNRLTTDFSRDSNLQADQVFAVLDFFYGVGDPLCVHADFLYLNSLNAVCDARTIKESADAVPLLTAAP